MNFENIKKLSKYLSESGHTEEADYIDSLLKFKNKKEWSIDHEKILELARSESPSSEYIAPIESIHQINGMLLQYKEDLKSKLLRVIGKHKRRGEFDIEMVKNTIKNLCNTISLIDSAIELNRLETNNFSKNIKD